MLQGPAWDKLAALMVQMVFGFNLDIKRDPRLIKRVAIYFQHTDPDMIDMDGVVDIDVKSRYHDQDGKQRFFSATQMVAYHLNCLGKVPERALEQLRWNNENGCLKTLSFSFARLVRQMYEVPHGTSVNDDRAWRTEVVQTFLPVVYNWFRYLDGDWQVSDYQAKRNEFFAICPEFGPYQDDEGRQCPAATTNPVTLPGQAWHMLLDGASAEKIRLFVEFWESWFLMAAENDKSLEESIRTGQVPIETKKLGRANVAFVRTNNKGVANALFGVCKDIDIVVVTSTKRNMAILPRRGFADVKDMKSVYIILNELEPGIWYFDPRGMVMNGSAAIEVTPTCIRRPALESTIAATFPATTEA
jgi:hypothetical protein